MSVLLAIETSCDETSIAVLDYQTHELRSTVVYTQMQAHAKHGGVVPELASRMHTEHIESVYKQALDEAKCTQSDIACIAVTKGPGLIGSLMVGQMFAKTLSLLLDVPLRGIHHIAGHIYATQIEHEMKFPHLSLVVSGGHTELVFMKAHNTFDVLGTTRDDAIGEVYDKVARVLQLPYPGGPSIDRLFESYTGPYLSFPISDLPSYEMSYSGLKSSVINMYHNAMQRKETIDYAQIAASFQKSAVEQVLQKLHKAVSEYHPKQISVVGGVSSNTYLRRRVYEEFNNVEVCIPSPMYCTDNAAMIGMRALYLQNDEGSEDITMSARSSWEIE